ncbi:MAG TPA: hypothetical protein VGH28_03745 [Polyangiaceae bacterium]|jgi:hypothetical protein
MLSIKKIVAIATTLAAVAVPSLALADNDYVRRDDYSIQQMRNQVQHDKWELARAQRQHRWADVRADRQNLQRDQWQLNRMLRHR